MRPAMRAGRGARQREDGEIGALLEIVERGLAIADRGELTAQQVGRGAVHFGLLAGIDHRDLGAGPQRRAQVP